MTADGFLDWIQNRGMKIPTLLVCLNGIIFTGSLIALLYMGSFDGAFSQFEKDSNFERNMKVSFLYSMYGFFYALCGLVVAKFLLGMVRRYGISSVSKWLYGVSIVFIWILVCYDSSRMFSGSMLHPLGYKPFEQLIIR